MNRNKNAEKMTGNGTTAISVSIQGMIDPLLGKIADRAIYTAQTLDGLIDGLEIGGFTKDFHKIEKALRQEPLRRILRSMPMNTLHIAAHPSTVPSDEELEGIVAVANKSAQSGLCNAISFHLDMFPWFEVIEKAADPGLRLVFENLGGDAERGNTVAEAKKAAERFPDWRFLLDTAHAMETKALRDEGPDDFARALDGRIEQIHFSWPGNLYPRELMGLDFSTRHSLSTMAPEKTGALFEFLGRHPVPLVIIEGVVPEGEAGWELLRREIETVRSVVS
ncbi:MAG TPA: hypothetical protein ENI69_04715 [Rhodospirillales bacterium]|nr:hypothetical protein [Rhodospirillales bacterium]